jgi:hypothetical protein
VLPENSIEIAPVVDQGFGRMQVSFAAAADADRADFESSALEMHALSLH